ncbi:EamA family transporter [candidate division KSB3 bacterium]|uniref:EamA family transporter n=1 Tax=candidate division KSB3 bacterium TaxID=2044937 RepID=A0A9D5Q4X4_9BACT|nr:EamA family transporter [candidate division KSB3 bacterium]MBD3323652.1 EamA family transporter [candidate division KSB3 bacterium]
MPASIDMKSSVQLLINSNRLFFCIDPLLLHTRKRRLCEIFDQEVPRRRFPFQPLKNPFSNTPYIKHFSSVAAMQRRFSRELLGSGAILVAAVCFYMETVAVRWATFDAVALDSSFLAFSRFFLGFLVVGVSLLIKWKLPRPRQYRFLLGRAFTNVLAVLFFFKAVALTTLAEANILNQTAPIFIAIISWMFIKEQRDLMASIMTVIAFCGIFLVVSPGDLGIQVNTLWGLASGVMAGITITCLNLTRQHNDSETILFIVFAIGAAILLIVFGHRFHLPNTKELYYFLMCGGMGIIGQYLLTMGFRYVTAVKGSILLSIRILIAAIAGPYITSDPPLELTGWLGAIIILATNIYFILHKTRIPPADPVS